MATILDRIEVVESGTRRLRWLMGGALIVAASLVGAGKVATIRRRVNELESAAYTDHLTGLQNRRSSEKRLQEELVKVGCGSYRATYGNLILVTADLDNLKEINDRHGHEAGDRYLRAFARLLKENLRTRDWAGRMGGDEFVIALWDNDGEEASQAVVGRLLDLTRSTVVELPGGRTVNLSASSGVAECTSLHSGWYEAGPQSPCGTRLYERADHALLKAKRAGKDRIVYA